jgi:hypothetical protein
MAPSQGYRKLNDNLPSEIEDLEDLLQRALFHTGIKKREQKWFDREDLATEPYRKENPMCIRQILKGVLQGQRNETAIRLSSYYVNFRQLEPKRAFRELVAWNRLNTPPLGEPELQAVFESTVRGRYVFGCEDDILKSFCGEDVSCSLKKKELETAKVAYDADAEKLIEEELHRIIEARNQLQALEPHLDVMVVGEENTKKAIVVLLLSAKASNPEMKQIILLKATEGAGKSRLMKVLTQGYKVKDVGRFSAHALDYSNLEDFEILRLKELGNLDDEKQGVSTIKFLSSDDQGYTVEITAKDEATGRFTTEQYKIPSITTFSSTIRLLVDSQFERRAWLLGLDETPEQTARISKWRASLELQNAEKLLGLRKITDLEFSNEVYKRFIEQIKLKDIIIPFPRGLLDLLGTEVLRIRGDMDKLLNFVKFYGQLNLKRLQKLSDNLYVLTPEVAVEAATLITEPLVGMLSKIDKRTRELFDALKSIIDVKEREIGVGEKQESLIEEPVTYCKKNATIDKQIREKIAVQTHKSEKTIRAFFSQLESGGYVSSDNKKPKTFTLLYDVSDIEKKLKGMSAKTTSADNLMFELEKEAREWLKTRLENFLPRMGTENPSPDTVGEKEANSYLEEKDPSAGEKISNPSLPPFQTAMAETSLENRQIQKLPNRQAENIAEISDKNDVDIPPEEKEPLFNSCYFCQKPIFEDDWKSDEFTAYKPAHKECYEYQKSLLKKSEAQP